MIAESSFSTDRGGGIIDSAIYSEIHLAILVSIEIAVRTIFIHFEQL